MVLLNKNLSKKLAVNIILFSSVLTLILTGFQLYSDYKKDILGIHNTLRDVELGLLGTLSSNLWLDDKEELGVALKGINALPGINYAAIYVNGKVYVSSGTVKIKEVMQERIPIEYYYNEKMRYLGELYIEADLSVVYQRLLHRFWLILASNAIKTLIVAMFIFLLVEKLIIHKLSIINRFIEKSEAGGFKEKIEYVSQIDNENADELDAIAAALNRKQERLEHFVGQLQNSEQRVRLLLESTGEGIFGVDTDGICTFVNPMCIELLGGSGAEEYLGSDMLSVIGPEMDPSRFWGVLEIDAPHILYRSENTFIRKDGSTFPVHLTRSPILWKGKLKGYVVLFNDISEQKLAQAALVKAKEQAEQASHAKTQFLSNMSHELRTPLNAILGFGQLLFYDDSLNDSSRESVQEILKGGEHLLELIGEILDLSRIEAGKLPCNLDDCRLDGVISESIGFISPLAEQNRISLDYKQLDTETFVRVDSTRFKQILINLLSNAIKYNKEHGHVQVSCVVHLDQGYARIEVTDSGLGLSEEEQQVIFEPFERVGRYEGVDGTGVGLTISKSLVEMMNGQIGVSSAIGQGSTFWITVPLSPAISKTQSLNA
ncbi:MAG: ATP-binding protein [Gammaproteobacteria bacterium]|nr:ATP-binding protein [Gammaproteobacteria bacterium]